MSRGDETDGSLPTSTMQYYTIKLLLKLSLSINFRFSGEN